MRFSSIAVCILLMLVIAPGSAHAYLDAQTGSMILQLILGGLAGLALVAKLMWHRIMRALGLRQENDDAGS